MKTTATKLSVLAFLGLGLAVYGQSGKVEVNISSPRATLDVQPNATNSQDNAKTNEGILAPQLSKTRVANIEAPVEGTLVYVIDDANKTNGTINAYTGADPKVAKITEKGYYYYNGTEWVKSAANSLDQEWVYNSSTKNIELKRSGTSPFNNKVYFDENGGFKVIDNPDTSVPYFNSKDLVEETATSQSGINKHTIGIKTSTLTLPASVTPSVWGDIFATGSSISSFIDTVPDRATSFNGTSSTVYAPTTLSSLKSLKNITGNSDGVDYHASQSLSTLTGNYSKALIGINAEVTTTYAKRNQAFSYSNKAIGSIRALDNYTYLRGNGSINTASGSMDWVVFQNASTATVEKLTGKAILLRSWQGSNPTIKLVRGIELSSFINDTATNSTVPNIEDNTGLYIGGITGGTTTNRGIYIGNVTGNTSIPDQNFAIYTNAGTVRFGDKVGVGVDTPTEKLEVAGNVKATGFVGTNAAIFPDYVFQKYYTGTSSLKADYNFKTLSQVEDFVKTNGHLPGYQSATEIKKQGYIDLMATQLTNVEKIEELYLHSIEQDKALKAKDAEIKELKERLSKIEALLSK
ncbi:hypothetical protein PG279_09305 [Riemerella anatipestifer]|nr:hypothetical protein [Riemerella anatipestifer]